MSDPIGFISTRDPLRQRVDFETALLRGLAPDGGLYIPERIPRLEQDWRQARSLAECAELLLHPYLGTEVEAGWLEDLEEALDFEVPLRTLSGGRLALLELFHGPTRAFKDVAARTLGRWWARALRRASRRAVVLVATSGDTGSAVAAGMAGIDGLEVVVLFPDQGVSPVQRAQLTMERPGVRAVAVAGTFDDAQRLVKEAFVDPQLSGLGLTSANSINLGRWLPQMSFHVWGLAQLAQAGVDPGEVVVVVPSGNLGNLLAGLLASAMGAGPAGFIAAHNRNSYLSEFLSGRRAAFDFPATLATPANAMDVGAPSNFERLHALWGLGMSVPLLAESVDDQATLRRMASCYEHDGVLVCPHTAVGLEVAARSLARDAGRFHLVHATAHPAKFPEVVNLALPGVVASDPLLDAALRAPQRELQISPELGALRELLLSGV